MLRRKLHWAMEDMLYLKMKSTHSDELEAGVLNLGRYLKAPGPNVTNATRRFLDHCVGSEEALIYRLAKEYFEEAWNNLTKNEQEEIDADVATFRKGLAALRDCCHAHPSDMFCEHVSLDDVEWNALRRKKKQTTSYPVQSLCRMEAEKHLRTDAVPVSLA
eukprot:2016870-Amphidinium_carterae.1